MKKPLLFLFISFISFIPVAFAQTQSGFVALSPIPGLTSTDITSVVNSASLANFFNNLYKYVIGVGAILAIIQIIWGGLEIALNRDDVSKITDSKGKIYNAVFGLVLVLSPVLVFSIINPNILNLSLNLPMLNTSTSTPTGTSGGTANGSTTATTDQSSGCSVRGTAGILQVADCPSATAATAWGQSCSGNLSIGSKMTLADGTVTSEEMLCSGKQSYVFIQLKSLFSFSINTLKPLSVTTDNPNNATDALNFLNICQGVPNGKTCISDIPLLTFAIQCQPTPKTSEPAGEIVGCFSETLSCVPAPGIGELVLNPKCASSPSWTPFQ